MADVTCGWSCRKKNVAERYINDILAQFSEAEEQERAEKALQSCLKRNPKKYDPATQEGRAAIGRYLYARGFASKYIQKSINNIQLSIPAIRCVGVCIISETVGPKNATNIPRGAS